MNFRPVFVVCGGLALSGLIGTAAELAAPETSVPRSETVQLWHASPASQSFRESQGDFLRKVGANAEFGFTVEAIKAAMVFVPPGRFSMGSEGGEDDERPVTDVTITRGFWLSRYEVTQEEWRTIMNLSPSHYKGLNRPVEFISWKAAQEFCQRLTAREQSAGRLPRGYAYRLPTEAEWEYACRLGTEHGAPGVQVETGWFAENGKEMSHPVGEKLPNALGLYDVFGNVSEWCQDWFGKYPGGHVADYSGPISGDFRVARGGNSFDIAYGCRPSYRTGAEPIVRSAGIGMRLALAPELFR